MAAELLRDFPEEIELIPIPYPLNHDIDIDVWLPDPYATHAMRVWPHLHGVKIVLCLMAGTEWIPPLAGPHVTICNARGAHNISTAEWTVSAILATLKNFPLYLDIQHSGQWKRRTEATSQYERLSGDKRPLYPPVLLEELTDKTVLLVGHGSIGKEIERMLEPFHVGLLRVARSARAGVHAVSELDGLLPSADVVVLILPLTEDSRGLMGSRQFSLMRQGALLVNAARGPIVQTDALVEALQSGKIRAALDVTDPEPLPEAGSSPQFAPRSLHTAACELRRYMNGEPLHNVVQAAI
jgi:phosphoglycerate dehydrogenase-like enzyme